MATIPEALAIAIQHHQAGRLQAAEQIYRQVLSVEPNHAQALHQLGLVAHQVGRHDLAVEYIGRAIQFNGKVAAFHNNLGTAYLALGKAPEAIACCRRALQLNPDYAAAHNNLGNALNDRGKAEEAAACYRRALELAPDFVGAHVNLGNALGKQGSVEEAAACYRRALELKPDFAEAHYNLGNACKALGKVEEAAACYRRAIALKPDYAEAHSNLGVALKDLEKLAEAIACYRRAIELKPDYAEAHNNLGLALKDQAKPDEAVASYRRAIQSKPDFAEAHYNLGIVLHDQHRFDDAVACYRRALELKPDYPQAYNNLGVTLNEQGKLEESIACYRRAVELRPTDAETQYNLGNALREQGDLGGAEGCFRIALRHDPQFALAHYSLAGLLGGKLPADDGAAQRRLLQDPALTDEQRLLFHFGLAYVLDAQGEYAQAAAHLDPANTLQLAALRKAGPGYDPEEYGRLVTRMIEVCTPEFFQRVRGFGLESELPVFVVGLPRSGTTLVEQVLASHSQIFGAGELPLVRDTSGALGTPDANFVEGIARLDRPTAQRLAARHLEKLRALGSTARRIVDKTPDNYLSLGLLAGLFPQAKVIHCRRDLRDVAVSCWMTHFAEVPWASDRRHIAARFHDYQRMMAHWRNVLPAPMLEVDYEETVADLEAVARRLVAWCGLEWEPACLDFHRTKRPVKTASSVQVRQPVYKTSVGRWKHYEHALASLLAELGAER